MRSQKLEVVRERREGRRTVVISHGGALAYLFLRTFLSDTNCCSWNAEIK